MHSRTADAALGRHLLKARSRRHVKAACAIIHSAYGVFGASSDNGSVARPQWYRTRIMLSCTYRTNNSVISDTLPGFLCAPLSVDTIAYEPVQDVPEPNVRVRMTVITVEQRTQGRARTRHGDRRTRLGRQRKKPVDQIIPDWVRQAHFKQGVELLLGGPETTFSISDP